MIIFVFWGIAVTGMGIVFLLSTLIPRKKCTLPLYGICTEYQRIYGLRGQKAYAPVFEYIYNGKQYRAKSRSSIGTKALPEYQPGTRHQIWISEEKPEMLISSKSYSFKEIIFLMCGVAGVVVGIFAIIVNASLI